MRQRHLVKVSGIYHVRIRRQGWDALISTGQASMRKAQEAASRIVDLFDREKRARAISRRLCEYAMRLTRGELDAATVAGPLAALEREQLKQALDLMAEIFPARTTTAADLWERYERTASASGAKERTLAARRQHFARFTRWAGNADVVAMREEDARRFLDAEGLSGQTRNNMIGDLSVVWKASGLASPWGALRVVAVHKERQEAGVKELRAVVSWMDSHAGEATGGIPLEEFAAFVRVLYHTGLRPIDGALLTRDEIRAGRVELLPEKTSRTGRRISVCVTPALQKVLDGIPVAGADLFPHVAEIMRESPSTLPKAFSAVCQKAGLEKGALTLYGLRHHFVTAQMDRGASPDDVAAAVGHKSAKTTEEFYYHGRRGVQLGEMEEI